MRANTAYVLLDCGCHPMVSIVAPRHEGERHSVSFPRFATHDEEVPDETHLLVAKSGKWEIVK